VALVAVESEVMPMYGWSCQELAEHFLEDELSDDGLDPKEHDQRVKALAHAIQDAVEEWLEEHKRSE
jgi:hypothetical protein